MRFSCSQQILFDQVFVTYKDEVLF